MINELSIKEGLDTDFVGRDIIFRETVDSTNLLAKRNSHLPEGTLFVAGSQTNGRGRLGRDWSSQSSAGIYMSILLKPKIHTDEVSKITLLAGLAVCRIIKDSKIKYPNDIVMSGKKVCGILCEMLEDEKGSPVVVCGIGINVNNSKFDEELSQKATSLFLETGTIHSKVTIIQSFLLEFEKLYGKFLETGITQFMPEYRKNCVNIGSQVRAFYENKEIVGECVDITDSGTIVIKSDNGLVEISAGEISVRGIYGYI